MPFQPLRSKIDSIDNQILDLLNQRATLAVEIGRLKANQGRATFAPEREVQLLDRVEKRNMGPIPPNGMRAIFREIVSTCRNLERPVSVGYLGPQGTWSHLAARQQFGATAAYEPLRAIGEVFNAVETSRSDFGVVPVENSTAGSVGDTLDRFMQTTLTISAEILYMIHFALLSTETDINAIKRVYSLPIATDQCKNWLSEHLPSAEIIPVEGDAPSTAGAAQLAAKEPGSAAIASRVAGDLYNLNTLVDHIEDSVHNRTRFFVVGHHGSEASGRDKTSILFSVAHRPGSLKGVLDCLDQHGINMTMISSRPSRQMPWEYIFFIDIQGHARDPQIASTIIEMQKRSTFLRVLGSYPEVSGNDGMETLSSEG